MLRRFSEPVKKSGVTVSPAPLHDAVDHDIEDEERRAQEEDLQVLRAQYYGLRFTTAVHQV